MSQHLWFYSGDPAKGLPPFFYLLFFKPHGVGELRLYSPLGDGPSQLVQGSIGARRRSDTSLMALLGNASPELARASLSIGPRPIQSTFGNAAPVAQAATS